MTDIRKSMRDVLSEVDANVAEQAESLAERLLQVVENDKALKNKAEKSGMPLGILKKVFKRGVAAWKGGHRPGTNPQQWGLARVNSFVTKSSGTWGKADADLAKQVRGEEVVRENDEPASPDEGSMAVQQLEFMMHAVTRMKDHIASGGEFPEWMQNKLASTHEKLKSLYANIDHAEAVSPAQQAAIAISKKERGEKPKKGKE